ncbi:hypothetical protein HPB48_009841 [Haemaphysalis longicornis]|uniref:Uncharacterized protein n=1 Tax=Haemaphysalis longicornis TaxID=44386 RepID=A0A9J6GS93_HAELO|nr:hypothetical protein HPB48_009841 [Haemaphysalis longicornis]
MLRAGACRNERRRDRRWAKARPASQLRDIQRPFVRYRPFPNHDLQHHPDHYNPESAHKIKCILRISQHRRIRAIQQCGLSRMTWNFSTKALPKTRTHQKTAPMKSTIFLMTPR